MAQKPFPEIKKKNRGKFTRWVKKNMKGKSTCDAAKDIMDMEEEARKEEYSTEVIEMANYANNFGCKNK